MKYYKASEQELTNVANAIRTKGGTSSSLVFPDGFVAAIGNIPTGGGSTLISKSVTENGTYNASSDNADGYSAVTVNVPVLYVKAGQYTVAESWESGKTGNDMITAALADFYDENAFSYVLIFTNNTNTSGYRVDAIITGKAASSSDIPSIAGFMYRNYYASTTTFGSSGRASQGTVIEIYKALLPSQ